MVDIAQNFDLYRGTDHVLTVTIANGAGATAADWYIGESRETVAANRDLALSVAAGGISIADSGTSLIATVTITKTQSEALPAGRRWHELWITDAAGKALIVTTGIPTVYNTMRT